MGRFRERRFKRALRKARGKGPVEETMPNIAPYKKKKTVQVSKGGLIRAKLSSGGPAAKPN